jgi:signal peptidase II
MRLPRLTLAVATAVVLIDAVSKLIVAHVLVAGQVIRVGALLKLELYYNHAGAGNALTGRPLLVSALSIFAVLALVAMGARVHSRGMSVGIGLLLGGGVGNLVDRLAGSPGPFRGGVIDWIRPFSSPGSLNLADLAINLGVVVFAGAALWRSVRKVPGPLDWALSSPGPY